MPEDLPAEPPLDKYRDAIASVHLNGTHAGYLARRLSPCAWGSCFGERRGSGFF